MNTPDLGEFDMEVLTILKEQKNNNIDDGWLSTYKVKKRLKSRVAWNTAKMHLMDLAAKGIVETRIEDNLFGIFGRTRYWKLKE